jgi:hypothetical protein
MAVLAGLAGCSSGEETPAQQVAERFYSAVGSGQGTAACGLLAPRTAEQMRSDGAGCAASILQLDLSAGGVRATEVWGGEAQVRLAGDTVFLHRFSRGWLVRAAGCSPRGEQPYLCKVGS